MAFLLHLCVRPFIKLLPGFSASVFDRGTEGVAVLTGVLGLGTSIFGVVLVRRCRTGSLARANVLAVFCSVRCLFVFTGNIGFLVRHCVHLFIGNVVGCSRVWQFKFDQKCR